MKRLIYILWTSNKSLKMGRCIPCIRQKSPRPCEPKGRWQFSSLWLSVPAHSQKPVFCNSFLSFESTFFCLPSPSWYVPDLLIFGGLLILYLNVSFLHPTECSFSPCVRTPVHRPPSDSPSSYFSYFSFHAPLHSVGVQRSICNLTRSRI